MTNKRIVLIVASMSAFMTPFMGSSINIALPAIGKEFDMDAILLGWIATSYILTSAVCLVPFGRIADLNGRKKVFTAGIFIFAISSFALCTARSSTMLLVFRSIQGIGGAMVFGTGVAILTSVFPAGERGRIFGINTASVYTGLSLGPTLGGFLTQHFGWRSIFIICGVLGLLTFLLILWKMKGEWAEAEGERMDYTGSLIYGITLILIIYGLTSLPKYSGIVFTISGLICGAGFVIYELRIKNPVIQIKLFFENRVFAFSGLAALINYSSTTATGFILSLYLQYIKNLTPQQAGLVLLSQPVVMAVFSPITGKMSDKIEPRILASLGMGLSAAGLLFLIILKQSLSLNLIVLDLIVLGAGFSLFSSPNVNAIMSSVEKKFYGVASSTVSTMRLVGHMFSMGLVMFILSTHMGKVKITPDKFGLFLTSSKIAFSIFSFLCFLGIFASLARGKIRK